MTDEISMARRGPRWSLIQPQTGAVKAEAYSNTAKAPSTWVRVQWNSWPSGLTKTPMVKTVSVPLERIRPTVAAATVSQSRSVVPVGLEATLAVEAGKRCSQAT